MKLTFTIKEFSEATGISAYNLRFFDSIGLLKPKRDSNGYRIYLLPQIAIAKMISILQKAGVPNKDIIQIIDEFNAPKTIQKLNVYRDSIGKLINELQHSYEYLSIQIDDLHAAHFAKANFDQPFIEARTETKIGVLTLKTGNILDFFDQTGDMCNDEAWYLSNHYGFILPTENVQEKAYPLTDMYSYLPQMIERNCEIFPAGKYLTMYCDGSLEYNAKVHWLKEYAIETGYLLPEHIFIENVTGPVLEKEKSDFVIKIMIYVGG